MNNKIIQRLFQILILAIAIIIGGQVNMAIIKFGPKLIPYPNNIDPANFELLKQTIPSFEPKHFLSPFLAHALGTLVAVLIVAFGIKEINARKYYAYFAAAMFFVGGAMAVKMLPAPMWFNITDLSLAYFPMAYLVLKLKKD